MTVGNKASSEEEEVHKEKHQHIATITGGATIEKCSIQRDNEEEDHKVYGLQQKGGSTSTKAPERLMLNIQDSEKIKVIPNEKVPIGYKHDQSL